MKYSFSKHSLEQIKLRNLKRSIITDVIENPDKIIDDNLNSVIHQINTFKDPSLVITAYKTSKIDKYEDPIR